MEASKDKHYSDKDALEQQTMDQLLGEYQNKAQRAQLEELTRREVEHQENMRKVDEEKWKALDKMQAMGLSEEEEHERKMAAEKKKGEEALERTAQKMDGVTKETLDSIEAKARKVDELSIKVAIETNQTKEKNKEHEMRMKAAVFNEVTARQEKNEQIEERREKELEEKDEEIRNEELRGIQAEREQQNENSNKLVALRREDAHALQKFAEFNTALLQNDCDSKNRAKINDKIFLMQTLAGDAVGFYDEAFGSLSLEQELFAKLKPMRMKKITRSLTRFSESIKKVSEEIGYTEQQLASLELDGVDTKTEFYDIKMKISEFSEVIAYLKTRVSIDDRNIDQTKVEDFRNLKNELYEMINSIRPISVNREQVHGNLMMLKESTSESYNTAAKLAIGQ